MRLRRILAIHDGAAPRGPDEHELAFRIRWGDMTNYHSEVARGIVHTPEWKDLMDRKRVLYEQVVTDQDSELIWTFPLDQLPCVAHSGVPA